MAIKVNEATSTVQEMEEIFTLVQALLIGTKAMRRAGQTYMPKRLMEENADYTARLKVSTLYPAFSETVAKMTGRAFSEPMIMNDDIADWIGDEEEGCLEDIDMQGRSVHVFARDVFATGLGYGMTHVLVDAPIAVKDDGSPIVTRADEKNADVRPYAIHIHPKRVLGWKEKKGMLTQLRIWGSRTVDEQFGESEIPQVWVYELVPGEHQHVTMTMYEKVDGKEEWQQYLQPIIMQIDRIPLVTFYSKRTGFMQASPPLLELAYLNVKHWNKQSDADELIKVASVPILVEYGGGESTQITIGAKSALKMPQDASLEFCEHSGLAIKAGQDDLESLKQEMRDAGAKLLQPGPALTNAKTATQVNEEAAADNSILGAIITDYEDFWSQVLGLFAAWRGEDVSTGGSVQLQSNLDPDMSPIDSLKLMLDMTNSGKLSGQTLYEQAQKHGILPEEQEWAEEQRRMKEEEPMDQAVNIDPATGLPIKKPAPPSPNPSIPNSGD